MIKKINKNNISKITGGVWCGCKSKGVRFVAVDEAHCWTQCCNKKSELYATHEDGPLRADRFGMTQGPIFEMNDWKQCGGMNGNKFTATRAVRGIKF